MKKLENFLYKMNMDLILLLQQLPGFGRQKINEFLQLNKMFLEDVDYIEHYVKSYTGNRLDLYMDSVKRIKDECHRLNIEIVKVDRSSIIDPPHIIYLKGKIPLLLNDKILAIVGTREPSLQGIVKGRKNIEHAISCGWTTVSGLARGSDTLCHKESIRLGGNTIAVLPGGYRKEIAPWILNDGLFISEYPPGSKIKKYKCIERNRIIAGLSRGLYVIESQKGGGSEHSIKFAYNLGIPISYSIGFSEISKYKAEKIENSDQFDQYLKKCIK